MKKWIAGVLVMLVCSAGIGIGVQRIPKEQSVTVLQADYPQYSTAEELIGASDLVFAGKVKHIVCRMTDVSADGETDEETGFVDQEESGNEEIPYTFYTIGVENVYKGSVEASELTVKHMGEAFDTGEYVVEGAAELPEIIIGKSYLFIVETYGDAACPSLLNLDQSVYEMDTAQDINEAEGSKITAGDVLKVLAEENGALTLEDFSRFPHTDIGSGQYVLEYSLSGGSYLHLCGSELEALPENIYISSKDGGKRRISGN